MNAPRPATSGLRCGIGIGIASANILPRHMFSRFYD